jgi:CDP-glucose 4,6-dehydratase
MVGGGDWAKDRLVPDILAAFEAGRPVEIRNPHAVRPWQHVLEPLRGYLTVAEGLHQHGPRFAEAWNFGPNDADAKPVSWIAENMAALWGSGAKWHVDSGQHPHEAGYLKLDISKARARLGWNPRLDLAQGLRLVVDWVRARQSGADMRGFTMQQILAYQAMNA